MGRPLPFTNPARWYDHLDARKTVNDRAIQDGLIGTDYSPFWVDYGEEEEYPKYSHTPHHKHNELRNTYFYNRYNTYGGPPYYPPTYVDFSFKITGDTGFLFVIYKEEESTHNPIPDYIEVVKFVPNNEFRLVRLRTNAFYARSHVVNGQHRWRRFRTTCNAPVENNYRLPQWGARVEWLD